MRAIRWEICSRLVSVRTDLSSAASASEPESPTPIISMPVMFDLFQSRTITMDRSRARLLAIWGSIRGSNFATSGSIEAYSCGWSALRLHKDVDCLVADA